MIRPGLPWLPTVMFLLSFIVSAQTIVVSPREGVARLKPDFDVQVWVDKDPSGENVPEYEVGDRIRIGVFVTEPSYIYLYSIKSTGKISQILPNLFEGQAINNYLKAGQTKLFPPTRSNYKFTVDGPSGLEKVVVIATRNPINPGNLALLRQNDSTLTSSSINSTATSFFRTIVENFPLNKWTTDTAMLNVRQDIGNSQLGTLYLNSHPAGAKVFVDGKFVGFTPTTYGSPIGHHDISFDLNGYEIFATRANISVGNIFPVQATLVPENDDMGTLLFRTNVMGAQIFVDGKIISQDYNDQEKIRKRLTVGNHQVTAVAPGFNTVIQYFWINSNRTTEVIIKQSLLD